MEGPDGNRVACEANRREKSTFLSKSQHAAHGGDQNLESLSKLFTIKI